MTSNHRSKTMLVLTVYICVMAIAITASLAPLWAQTSAPVLSASSRSDVGQVPNLSLTRAAIQSALDTVGYCWIPPGTHKLDGPIIIRADRTLAGAGKSSVLQLMPGRGDVALDFGESPTTAQPYLYGAYLDAFVVTGGSIRVNKISQHCLISRVWVALSPGDGFIVSGIGERLTLRDCVARENARHGFRVSAFTANTGIRFDNCNAQDNGGAGILLETSAPNAQLNGTHLRHCTIQGNQRRGAAPADLWIRGYVGATTIESAHIEAPLKVGLRAEPVTWRVSVGPFLNLPVTRRVGFLTLIGETLISESEIAAELIEANECRIEQLALHPASAKVCWSVYPPAGAMRRLKADQLINAAATLPAASQPGAITPVRRP